MCVCVNVCVCVCVCVCECVCVCVCVCVFMCVIETVRRFVVVLLCYFPCVLLTLVRPDVQIKTTFVRPEMTLSVAGRLNSKNQLIPYGHHMGRL